MWKANVAYLALHASSRTRRGLRPVHLPKSRIAMEALFSSSVITPSSRVGSSSVWNMSPRRSPVKAGAKEIPGTNDQLSRIWMERSSTPAFQHMVHGRMNLPIWEFKDEILNMLDTHRALIICSETGSGKSTQIPSFILEHEMRSGRPCKIYVTEPRRISAISLARRVSEELGESKNDIGTSRSLLGFAVRLESKISQSTRLVFAYVASSMLE